MATQSVEQLLIEKVSDASGIPANEISLTSTWEQLGIDSLDFMELIADVSLQIKNIPKNRILAIDTVADLLREVL